MEIKDIPFGYTRCFAKKRQCKKCSKCLRSITANMIARDEDWVSCVHPRYIEQVANGEYCKYFRPNQTVQEVRGFTHMCDKLPHDVAKRITAEVRMMFGRTSYFRRKKGLYPLSTAEQQHIIAIFRRNGVGSDPEFDSYVDKIDW